MKRVFLVTFLAATATVASPALAQNSVTTWDALVQAAVQVDRPPASAEYLHALAHLAMWDAMVAITGTGQPYLGAVRVTRPASIDAAVAVAAHRVAALRVPAQAAALTVALMVFLATVPDGPEKTNGMAAGLAAADQLLAARADDHFDATVAYVQPAPGPGVFEPVAPSPPIDVKLKGVTPLLPRAIDGFRPRGPDPLRSRRYARDLDEVKELGRAHSSVRTPEQTETVRFWADNTFMQYARSLRAFAISRRLDPVETSRLLTEVHLAMADSLLACFEAKYHFLFWRPVHAVTRADTDGNPRTSPDRSWTSELVVNHPEYPSGHGCFTSAATRVLRRAFGTDRVAWEITSTTTSTTRTFRSLRALRAEVGDARVWAGLHFRHSIDDADWIGRQAARLTARVLRRASLPGDDVGEDLRVDLGDDADNDSGADGAD